MLPRYKQHVAVAAQHVAVVYTRLKILHVITFTFFYVFYVFLKIQKVTFYVFCFVAYVFSNYATNSSDSLHGLWSLDCSTVFCFNFSFRYPLSSTRVVRRGRTS